ncbi:SusC/RagA family TonB-linked outer membrane protein [Flavobacterium sp. SM2513]|uniref:SusC/RagA family TonB-linked outer membrane protein n=1 Tax=Flavobacterium sp. SM2513 TaxID=3424766 RepID=UPI003D7F5867
MKINLLFRARAGYVPFALLQMLLLFWVATGSAQNVTVTGTVSDAQGVLPGVNVQVKNKSVGTTSDANGAFAINAVPEDKLVFSFIGYVTQEVLVGSQTKYTIVLQPDETALDEVLVNAGYYKVKDKERTGSIAKITAKDIETQPVSNVLATMQGRMAGVHITQQSGTAGTGFNIQIRGQNSVRRDGNTPLYIIDGVPFSSDAIGNGDSMASFSVPNNPLSSINPSDIESLEVLKDADATAIYGSRGANGVVLITTKRGKAGKTQFTASMASGFGSVAHFMKLMNTEQYLAMRAEGYANDGITEYPATAYDINGTWDQSRYTDWQKELVGGTSTITNANVSVSGGSEQTQFMVSGTYGSEGTVLPGNFGYSRISVRPSFNHTSKNQRFKMAFTGGYNLQKNDQPSTDITLEGSRLAPNAPALYDAEGNLNWEDGTFENPLALLRGLSTSKTHDLVANSTLSYSLFKNLEFKTSFGYTHLTHHESSTYPSTMYNPKEEAGSAFSRITYTDSGRESWNVEPQLNWKAIFHALRVDVLIGGTFQQQHNESLTVDASGFSSNSLIYNPAAASRLTLSRFDNSEYKYQSFFGRANFNLLEKYILNFTGRRDGSSRFGADKRFGWFGAIGGAWLFSKEKLFANSKLLSFGKLRGSYGTTGNDQIGNYQYLNSYTSSGANYDEVTGLQPSRLFNPDFGWESNTKLEMALETGFLNDRIFLTAAWYRNRSSNQLVGVPLPGTTGFTQIQSNLNAEVENKGIELTLETVNFKNENFRWTTSFNLSQSKNKLLSFPNLESSTYKNTYIIGAPLNIVKLFHYTGLDPDTGLYTFEDVNGDGVLTNLEDKKTVRDLNPSYYGGIHNQLVYKNWQLDFLFQFVKQQNYNLPRVFGIPGSSGNKSSLVLDHWQAPGDTGPTQVYTSGLNGEAVNASGRFGASDGGITDTSFLRLKNVALYYTLPEQWMRNVYCKLSLEGQNLLTFTPYKGADPEFAGIGYLPPLRVVTAGVQFQF